MRAQRLFPIALSLVLSILMMACKDDPVSPGTNNDPNALKGVWLLESIDGESFVEDGTIYTIGDGVSKITDAETGCYAEYTYTVSGDKITEKVTEDECSNQPVGSTMTSTWSITNNKLTVTDANGTKTILRRVAGNDRVVGSWYVTKIDGQLPPSGAGMNLYIYGSIFEVLKKAPDAQQPCLTVFSMTNNGARLDIEAVEDGCGEIPVGTTDSFAWTVNGSTLRLVLESTGEVIEAERM